MGRTAAHGLAQNNHPFSECFRLTHQRTRPRVLITTHRPTRNIQRDRTGRMHDSGCVLSFYIKKSLFVSCRGMSAGAPPRRDQERVHGGWVGRLFLARAAWNRVIDWESRSRSAVHGFDRIAAPRIAPCGADPSPPAIVAATTRTEDPAHKSQYADRGLCAVYTQKHGPC